jgi:hypothetical protein
MTENNLLEMAAAAIKHRITKRKRLLVFLPDIPFTDASIEAAILVAVVELSFENVEPFSSLNGRRVN